MPKSAITKRIVSTHSRAEAAARLTGLNVEQILKVSTHSRAEAAAEFALSMGRKFKVSTHSRAEAAAYKLNKNDSDLQVSTHSRAEAAAHCFCGWLAIISSFNTQPRRGGCFLRDSHHKLNFQFQHTAAQRRLLP